VRQDSNRDRGIFSRFRMLKPPYPAMAAAALLAAGFAAMLALNLPGQMSYDSVSQLFDGRFGTYNSWHPPVMAWLLGLFDLLLPGTGLFVMFEAAMLALAFILSLQRNAHWSAVPVMLAIVLTPQFLLYQGTVWKDVLFADAFVLAFALLARAARAQGRNRLVLFVLFFLALSLAALARQNGLLLLPVGAVTFGMVTADNIRRGATRAILALVLLLALVTGAGLLLARRGDGGEGLRGEIQLAQIYDLIGAMKKGFSLDMLRQSDPPLAASLQQQGARAYSLQMQDTLEPFLPAQIVPGAVMAQWQALLLRRPDLYLRERADLFWQVLATPDIGLCHPAYAGIDGDPAELKALGLPARIRPRDARLAAYARGFMGTPILSHLAFGTLAVGLLILYVRRRRRADLAMAGMLAGALVFTASFFFVSVACDYRYLYPLDLAAMLALFQIFAAPPSKVTKN
jgi:hypothetical protein